MDQTDNSPLYEALIDTPAILTSEHRQSLARIERALGRREISRTTFMVGVALVALSAQGQISPPLTEIARRAICSVHSVIRAKAELRQRGLLT